MNPRLQAALKRAFGNVPARMLDIQKRVSRGEERGADVGGVQQMIADWQTLSRALVVPEDSAVAEGRATDLENDCETMENLLTGMGV